MQKNKNENTEAELAELNDIIERITLEIRDVVDNLNLEDKVQSEATINAFVDTKVNVPKKDKIKGINKRLLKKIFSEEIKNKKNQLNEDVDNKVNNPEELNSFIKETTLEVKDIIKDIDLQNTLLIESTREVFIDKKIEALKEKKLKGINRQALKKLFNATLKDKETQDKAKIKAIENKRKLEKKESDRLAKINAAPELKKIQVKWFDTETSTKTGDQIPTKLWQNLEALLQAYQIDVKYNLISREIEFTSLDGKMKHIEKMGDNARLEEIRSLGALQKYTVNYDMLNMQLLAISSSKQYNPVAEYLLAQSKKWDGKDRIKELCNTITTTEEFDNDLKEIMISKWLMNCARQALNHEGTKGAFGVLTLQGVQNLGKSRWIQTIVPQKEWLKTGSHIDISSKDSIMENTKYWIVELGELDASMKNEQSKMKAFITRESDEFRRPYAKLSEKYPRYTVFYASVNPKQFLKDETGNRRYWTIPCIEINHTHEIDLDQLWGQVMRKSLNAKSINEFNLTDEEMIRLNESNKDFTVADDIDIYLEEIYDFSTPKATWTKYVSANALLTALKLKDPKINARAIKNALNKKGIEQENKTLEGKKTRCYALPSLQSVKNQDNPFDNEKDVNDIKEQLNMI